MDAKQILERIKDNSLLKSDVQTEWKEITEKYPFFSIGQYLQFGSDYFHDQSNLKKLALYKQDPMQFAHFINSLKQVPVSVVQVIEENKIVEPMIMDSTIEKEPEEAIELDEDYEELQEELPKKDILNSIHKTPNTVTVETETLSNIETHLEEEEKEEERVETVSFEETQTESIIEKDTSLMVMMSFSDWLNHFKQKTEHAKEEEKDRKALKTAWQKEKLTAALDEEDDEIPEVIFKQAMDSISLESTLISESLAEILAKQGKHEKAIDMYKKLSLRFPEKRSLFANRINELNLKNS